MEQTYKDFDIRKLRDNGTLTYLYRKGAISHKIFEYIDFHMVYRGFIRNGFSHPDAIFEAAQKCGKSENTIRRAIQFVEG